MVQSLGWTPSSSDSDMIAACVSSKSIVLEKAKADEATSCMSHKHTYFLMPAGDDIIPTLLVPLGHIGIIF